MKESLIYLKLNKVNLSPYKELSNYKVDEGGEMLRNELQKLSNKYLFHEERLSSDLQKVQFSIFPVKRTQVLMVLNAIRGKTQIWLYFLLEFFGICVKWFQFPA